MLLTTTAEHQDALGTALVLVGICIVASFADKESGCYTIDELVALYREPLFIMYAFLMGSAAIGIFLLSKRMEKVKARHGPSSHAYKRFRKVEFARMASLLDWSTLSLFE